MWPTRPNRSPSIRYRFHQPAAPVWKSSSRRGLALGRRRMPACLFRSLDNIQAMVRRVNWRSRKEAFARCPVSAAQWRETAISPSWSARQGRCTRSIIRFFTLSSDPAALIGPDRSRLGPPSCCTTLRYSIQTALSEVSPGHQAFMDPARCGMACAMGAQGPPPALRTALPRQFLVDHYTPPTSRSGWRTGHLPLR